MVRRGSDPSLSCNDKPGKQKYGVSSGEASVKETAGGFSTDRGSVAPVISKSIDLVCCTCLLCCILIPFLHSTYSHANLLFQKDTAADKNGHLSKKLPAGSRAVNNRFFRSSLRKSRLTEKWLEIAAETSSEYYVKYGNAPAHASGLPRPLVASSSSAVGLKQEHEFSVSPCDLWRPVGIDFETMLDTSGRVCRVIANGRFGLDNQIIAGDELTELNGLRVASFDTFEGVTSFVNHLPNNEPLSVKLLRYVSNAGSHELNPTAVEQQGASGLASSKGSETCLSALQKGNTRKLGKQITVKLLKTEDGLGFTLTSRDFASAEGVESPVCIKNILPRGSAIKDGRLRADFLYLKVDGKPVEGLTQPEVVKLLRSIEKGRYVELLVSRQESCNSPSILPRHLVRSRTRDCPPEINGNDTKYERPKRILLFDIPLNDSGSAGLGISVKGRVTSNATNTENVNPSDLGIFIKSVLHGGAAYKVGTYVYFPTTYDGRLKVDDQLIAVNECSLEGMSNQDALNQLRYTMKSLDPYADSIKLTVIRRAMECGDFKEVNGIHWSNRSMGSPDGADSLMLEAPCGTGGDAGVAEMARTVTFSGSVEGGYCNRGFSIDIQPKRRSSMKACRGGMDDRRESGVEEHSITLDDDGDDRQNSRSEHQSDAFDREAPTRQSMSEKRRTAIRSADVSDIQLYQKIRHTRQYSAPPAANKNATVSSIAGGDGEASRNPPAAAMMSRGSGLSRRLSISLESFVDTIGPASAGGSDAVLIHEQVAHNLKKPAKNSALLKSPVWCRAKMRRATFVQGSSKSTDLGIAAMAVSPMDEFAKHGETRGDIYVGSSASTSDQLCDLPANSIIGEQRNKGRRKSSSSSLASLKNLLRFGSGGKANKPVKFAVSTQKYTEHPFENFTSFVRPDLANNANGLDSGLKKQNRGSKEGSRGFAQRPSSELMTDSDPERNSRSDVMRRDLNDEEKGSASQRPTMYPPPPDYDYYLRSKTFEKYKKRNRPFSDYADICASGSTVDKLVPLAPPPPHHAHNAIPTATVVGSYVTRL
ncbi:unnamed protein product [Soboliphyme baturini]|uniref:PDZ domain-containing protein n=1 Tax=Soboliphyme baturini TaxID=241478 RepID=A0A183IU83_9BILA|nr:unnamed protein product [Soboliphyme baturini]